MAFQCAREKWQRRNIFVIIETLNEKNAYSCGDFSEGKHPVPDPPEL